MWSQWQTTAPQPSISDASSVAIVPGQEVPGQEPQKAEGDVYFVESVEVEGGGVAGEVVEVVMRWTLLNLFLADIAVIFLITAWAPGVPWFFLDFFVSLRQRQISPVGPMRAPLFNPLLPLPHAQRPTRPPPPRMAPQRRGRMWAWCRATSPP